MRLSAFIATSTAVLVAASTSVFAQGLSVRDWSIDGTRSSLLSTVSKTLGSAHGDYIAIPPVPNVDSSLIFSQFSYAFSGIPEPMENLQDGRRLFSGDDPVSPAEKAFVVTEGDHSTVVGMAILHQSCFSHTGRNTLANCPKVPTLTFFVENRSALNAEVREDVVAYVEKLEQQRNEALKGASADGRKVMLNQGFHIEVKTL